MRHDQIIASSYRIQQEINIKIALEFHLHSTTKILISKWAFDGGGSQQICRQNMRRNREKALKRKIKIWLELNCMCKEREKEQRNIKALCHCQLI